MPPQGKSQLRRQRRVLKGKGLTHCSLGLSSTEESLSTSDPTDRVAWENSTYSTPQAMGSSQCCIGEAPLSWKIAKDFMSQDSHPQKEAFSHSHLIPFPSLPFCHCKSVPQPYLQHLSNTSCPPSQPTAALPFPCQADRLLSRIQGALPLC